MDQSATWRLLESDWYSPRRLHDSPTQYDFPQVYRQKLIESLSLDSEGRPFRIMVFRGSPKSSRKSLCFVDEMRQEEAAIFDNDSKQAQYRCIPKGEKRVLDAAGLRNDYYVNIMS